MANPGKEASFARTYLACIRQDPPMSAATASTQKAFFRVAILVGKDIPNLAEHRNMTLVPFTGHFEYEIIAEKN